MVSETREMRQAETEEEIEGDSDINAYKQDRGRKKDTQTVVDSNRHTVRQRHRGTKMGRQTKGDGQEDTFQFREYIKTIRLSLEF